MKKISLPINGTSTVVESEHSFVIIGANGSGKSHLGAWIERQSMESILRISAQRALSIPEIITIKSEEAAWNNIFYGNEQEKNKGYKWNWNEGFTTKLVNDFESVLSAVFARSSKENEAYVKSCREHESLQKEKPLVPVMIKDKIINIWNVVFPHRQILLDDATVRAKFDNSTSYHGKEMSDGERVAIYLIAQCLVAPDDMALVIDEPEIHLHKTIMHKLWDKIEEYCPEKIFVYITHDLDFASTRKDAKLIWTKNYTIDKTVEKWEIELIESHDSIPDSLMIEVLGNRKNILFVEGDKSSYDYQLYSNIYSDYYVVPVGNCATVINMTRAFNEESVRRLHNIKVRGIIDRDYLTDNEIESYRQDCIYPLEVAEVENLFCIKELLEIIASHFSITSIYQVVHQAEETIFEAFQAEYEVQLSSICEREVLHKLRQYKKEENTKDGVIRGFDSIVSSINIEELYNNNKTKIDAIISNNNYNELLMIYNRKNLHKRIARIFDLKQTGYVDLILRLLKSDKRQTIVDAVKRYAPIIG